jgi:hypothetical protein
MGRFAPLGAGIALGALGAALYLAVLTGSPGALILAYLSQLPLFAAGLWFGTAAAAIAGLTAAAALCAFGGVFAAALFAGLYVVPIVVLVREALLARRTVGGALEWYPPGSLAAWLCGFGIAVCAGVAVFLGGPAGIAASMRESLAPALARLTGEPTAADSVADLVALVAPGAIAASWMAMTASNAVLAQGLLARFGAAWRPSPDVAALDLPVWPSALLAVATVLSMIAGMPRFIGVNLLIVLAVPFCLAGLAILHLAVRRWPRPQVPLIAFYVLAALFGWPLLVVTAVGALDAPLGLRRRLSHDRIGPKRSDT